MVDNVNSNSDSDLTVNEDNFNGDESESIGSDGGSIFQKLDTQESEGSDGGGIFQKLDIQESEVESNVDQEETHKGKHESDDNEIENSSTCSSSSAHLKKSSTLEESDTEETTEQIGDNLDITEGESDDVSEKQKLSKRVDSENQGIDLIDEDVSTENIIPESAEKFSEVLMEKNKTENAFNIKNDVFPNQRFLPSSIFNIQTTEQKENAQNYLSYIGPAAFSKSQEPWPKDVILFQPYEVEQILLPDNANCLAVQAFLKMCNLEYQVEPRANAEAMSPSGKVPFIKAGAFVVSELEGIVQFVNNRGISLAEVLDNELKSDLRAYMSLVHNVLENAELYVCWVDNETYNEVTSIRHGSVYPWPLNHIQNRAKRNAVIKKLSAHDWYKKSLDEVFEEVEICCQALSDRLGEKKYFFDKLNELDAFVFGHIYSISTTNIYRKEFTSILKKFESLINHSDEIRNMLRISSEAFVEVLNSFKKECHGDSSLCN